MNKNLLKPLVIVVLTLATLPIRAAALRHTVKQLASKAGAALRMGKRSTKKLPLSKHVLLTSKRQIKNQSFSSVRTLTALSALGVIATQTQQDWPDEHEKRVATRLQEILKENSEFHNDSERALCIKAYFEEIIANGDIRCLLRDKNLELVNLLFKAPRDCLKPFALKILQRHFRDMHATNILLFVTFIDSKTTSHWRLRLLTERFNTLETSHIEDCIRSLPDKELKKYASRILDQRFDELNTYHLITLIAVTKETEQKKWLARLLQNKKELPISYKIIPLLHHLPIEHQNKISVAILKEYSSLGLETISELLPFLSKEDQETTALKFLEKNPALTSYKKLISFLAAEKQKEWRSIYQEEVNEKLKPYECVLQHLKSAEKDTPLTSDYLANQVELNGMCIPTEHANFNELLPDIIDHVNTEYKKGNIVFFHGQQSRWVFLEHCFRSLLGLRNGYPSPENFIHLRFTENSLLLPEDVIDIVTNGITSKCSYCAPDQLLFCNLHPYANYASSNSMDYAQRNYDQTSKRDRSSVHETLEFLYDALGFTKEFEPLKNSYESVFKLYQEAIEDQGNHGRLIVISMPKETARRIAYSTKTGERGPLKPLMIKGRKTTDPVEIAKHYNEAPYLNEFCIILGPEMIEPELAKAAGIEIKGFDPAIYWETEKAQKYQNALKELMAETKRLYVARKTQEKEQQSRETLMERFYS